VTGDFSPGGFFVVKEDEAPLQVGKDVVARARKGERLQAIKLTGPWIWTEVRRPDGAKRGWIHKKHIDVSRSEPRTEEPTTR